MDWTTIVISFFSLIGGGGIATIVLLPQKRRSAELENEAKVSEQWRELFLQSKEEQTRKSDLIDKLYDDLKSSRDENLQRMSLFYDFGNVKSWSVQDVNHQ